MNRNEPQYMWLNNKLLQASPNAPRLDPKRIEAIIENFSPDLVCPIKVVVNNGKFTIVDGHHTRAALTELKKTADFPIFCKVYKAKEKAHSLKVE